MYFKTNTAANTDWESRGIFGVNLFSSLQLARQWTRGCCKARGMCRFSMVLLNNLLGVIFSTACCGVKWISYIIRHIYWLVSQTEACFVHIVPCQACHCLYHFSGCRTRDTKQRREVWYSIYDPSKWADIHIECISDERSLGPPPILIFTSIMKMCAISTSQGN